MWIHIPFEGLAVPASRLQSYLRLGTTGAQTGWVMMNIIPANPGDQFNEYHAIRDYFH